MKARKYSRLATSLFSMALICGGAILLPTTRAAQNEPIVNEKYIDLQPSIQSLRADAARDRRQVVKDSMLLTPSEAERFWPLYDQYRTKMHELGDRRVKLITDFAANRNQMSQDEAQRLMTEAFNIDRDENSTKRDFANRMQREGQLSTRTVARFFQIDSKLDAFQDAQRAAAIPLIH